FAGKAEAPAIPLEARLPLGSLRLEAPGALLPDVRPETYFVPESDQLVALFGRARLTTAEGLLAERGQEAQVLAVLEPVLRSARDPALGSFNPRGKDLELLEQRARYKAARALLRLGRVADADRLAPRLPPSAWPGGAANAGPGGKDYELLERERT